MDNQPVITPSQIGINESLWNDQSLDKYGVLGMSMDEKDEKTMPGRLHYIPLITIVKSL